MMEYMPVTNNELKDSQRRELLVWQLMKEYSDNKEYERLAKMINDNIDRLEKSLQD